MSFWVGRESRSLFVVKSVFFEIKIIEKLKNLVKGNEKLTKIVKFLIENFSRKSF